MIEVPYLYEQAIRGPDYGGLLTNMKTRKNITINNDKQSYVSPAPYRPNPSLEFEQVYFIKSAKVSFF